MGIDNVAILGSGPLAEGIAEVCRKAGCNVTEDPSAAELIIEAVADEIGAKGEAIASASATAGDAVIIATTTSALSVTDLATGAGAPERFGALHFLEPVADSKLVEVVPAEQTAPETVAALEAFVGRIGLESITTKDRPGFLVNRLFMPYMNQAIQAYDDGIATAKDIDVSVVLGLGYPIGPLELLDEIGLDAHEQRTRAAHEATGDHHYAPPVLLQRLIAAGRGVHDEQGSE